MMRLIQPWSCEDGGAELLLPTITCASFGLIICHHGAFSPLSINGSLVID